MPVEWDDGESHDTGIPWEEWTMHAESFVFISRGGGPDGDTLVFNRIGVRPEGTAGAAWWLHIYSAQFISDNVVPATFSISRGRNDNDGDMAFLQFIDINVMPTVALGNGDKVLANNGKWVSAILKSQYNAKIAELESRLSALEGN